MDQQSAPRSLPSTGSGAAPTAPVPVAASQQQGMGPWAALALIAVVLIAVGGATVWWIAHEVSVAVQAPPTVVAIHAQIKKIMPTLELKVGEAEIDVEATSEEASTVWGIPMGTSTTRIRAMGNRVSYLVPLREVKDADLELFDDGRTLRVTLPLPVVDPNVVFVQTDASKIQVETKGTWVRWLWPKNKEAEVRNMLRGAVVKAGNEEMPRREAARKAEVDVARFFEQVASGAGGSSKRVEIRWRP